MPRRKRQASTFNLSFLDIMSCGFGAVVLVFLIIDHSLEIEIQTVNAEVLSEVDLLEEDIREGEAGLVRLRNALDDADLEIVEADGLARRITEELDEYEALIAAIEESGVSETDAVAQLQAEINQLEEKIKLLQEAAEAEAGRSAREFVGEGNRQYLTGLNLGGRRIAILVDTSASMLANQLVNVIRLRNMDPAVQKQADKWVRTLNTVDWLTAQLPVNAQFQVLTFNTEAKPILADSEGQWLEVADTPKLEAISATLREQIPAGGTSLHNAFSALSALPTPPDNIFLLTDGLPTQGSTPSRGRKISGNDRLKLFREAIRK
ncbi:MAG: VWA domain-containing protein, partial [Halieaceae bacterium]